MGLICGWESLGKMAKNCMRIRKLKQDFWGKSVMGSNIGGAKPIFCLVGVNPPVPPPLGEILYISVTYPEFYWGH